MSTSATDITAIWTQYRSGLKAFLHSKVSNPSDVEDLLQDILIKTHRKLDTLQSDTSLRSWLYQIASNAIVDFYRRDKSRRPVDPTDLWYETIEADPLPELEQCLEPFINALPPEQSALLRAIDLNGKSQKDLAAELGISYSTLKSRVQNGRRQLRAIFDNCCEFSVDSRGNIAGYTVRKGQC